MVLQMIVVCMNPHMAKEMKQTYREVISTFKAIFL